MRDFLKQVLAVIVGTLVVSAFSSVMMMMMFISMILASDQTTPVADGSVLHLKLSGTISERVQQDELSTWMNMATEEEQGLDDILTAIRVAETDDRVDGIYIEGGLLNAEVATLKEIRDALLKFKESKKFVIAYGDNYTQGAYYVASVADKVYVNPSGMIDWHGVASQPMFFKELLEKVGVKMQVFRVGTYKSAVEPFTATEMSEANREQVSSYITDIWQGICQEVSASRKIAVDTLNQYANDYATLWEHNKYIETHLADSLFYIDQLRGELRRMTGRDNFTLVTPTELATNEKSLNSKNEIAVYYAYGDIVDQSSGVGTQSEIVGNKVVNDLDQLAEDEDIKAVVLRINSGGGSAYASEQMWRAIQELKKKKTVVVSMGDYAASGGYYMACGADRIFAQPSTLTGSIGIFGLVPDASGLLTDKLGLHFDVVKTNEAADFGAMGRSFNAAESAAMQQHVERGYKLFLDRVGQGRNMNFAQVDSIAQGRVWTGNQALKIGLVDELGSLQDAIAYAAKKANVADYEVSNYPAPLGFFETLTTSYQEDYLEGKMRSALGDYYQPLRFVSTLGNRPSLQARMPYAPCLR
jgi:protease-4